MLTQQKKGRNKQTKQGFFGQSRAAENGEVVTSAKQEGLERRISTAKLGADQYGACKLVRRHAGPKVHYKINVMVKSHCQCDHPENGFVTYGEAPIKIAITVIAKQARWRSLDVIGPILSYSARSRQISTDTTRPYGPRSANKCINHNLKRFTDLVDWFLIDCMDRGAMYVHVNI